MKRLMLAAAVAAFAPGVRAAAPDSDFDWHDAKDLTFEGQMNVGEMEGPFVRCPLDTKGKIPGGVYGRGRTSTGMTVRFIPHSDTFRIKWTVRDVNWHAYAWSSFGMAGIDVYGWTEGKGWRFEALGQAVTRWDKADALPKVKQCSADFKWRSGRRALVNFPLQAVVEEFKIGVPKGAKVEKDIPRSHALKPVVIYGTSIVHGGIVSRPGLAFANVAARTADVEMINLGFNGHGKMEMEMCDLLVRVDASLYILDCLWNMNPGMIRERFEPFVRSLKERRPDVPILLCGDCNIDLATTDRGAVALEVYERLKKENPAKWANLFFLPAQEMFPDDGEATVDRCHPDCYGAVMMGRVYARKIREILGLASARIPPRIAD